MSKLIKATVRKSGKVVYVGRVSTVRNYRNDMDLVRCIENSNGCTPSQISNRQRYMKVISL